VSAVQQRRGLGEWKAVAILEVLVARSVYPIPSIVFVVALPNVGVKRWSRDFGPVVKVDRLVRETIQNDETKEPFRPLPGSRLLANDERGISKPRLRLKRSAKR